MRQRTSAQAKQIEAEYQARREMANKEAARLQVERTIEAAQRRARHA